MGKKTESLEVNYSFFLLSRTHQNQRWKQKVMEQKWHRPNAKKECKKIKFYMLLLFSLHLSFMRA